MREDDLKLFIKNMINLQSLQVVKLELVRLGLQPVDISMGEADIQHPPTSKQQQQLTRSLRQFGLELLDNRTDILVHRIKKSITSIIYEDNLSPRKLSDYLGVTLEYDYTYLSNLFSAATKGTIEKFYICHKIERVKQLLVYEELTLTEIAWKLRYSSPSHLSNQFKKVTGSTPSHFKNENRDKHLQAANCG